MTVFRILVGFEFDGHSDQGVIKKTIKYVNWPNNYFKTTVQNIIFQFEALNLSVGSFVH